MLHGHIATISEIRGIYFPQSIPPEEIVCDQILRNESSKNALSPLVLSFVCGHQAHIMDVEVFSILQR